MSTNKRICHHCVREPYLSREIAENGAECRCSYCKRQTSTYALAKLADRVETAFEQHYRCSPPDPTPEERAHVDPSEFEWSPHGQPVVLAIEGAAEIPPDAAADVQRILESRHYDKHTDRAGEQTEFCSDAFYDERDADDSHWREQWFELEHTIKTQGRFFGHHAKELLAEAFDGIDKIFAGGRQPLVIDIGPEAPLKTVYRARVFQSHDALRAALCRPDRELGPPPSPIVPAGRMNARGIAVFYGADDADVAIAEVRPPVGSRVAVAQFSIIRPLRILSLGYLGFARAEGSIFDEDYAALCQRTAFLQSLSDLLCEPVLPDHEDLDYLPTQAVADFLANENDPRLDGVAYPSTQVDGSGSNVVLFHNAARVEEMELPDGTVIEATGPFDEEGFEIGYHVCEFVPSSPTTASASPQPDPYPLYPDDADYRQPALRVVQTSLKVHEVTRVQVSTHAQSVARQRRSPPGG